MTVLAYHDYCDQIENRGGAQHNSKARTKIRHLEIPLGARVQVRFDDEQWYSGKVNSQRSARGNYHVIFDDGDKKVGISINLLVEMTVAMAILIDTVVRQCSGQGFQAKTYECSALILTMKNAVLPRFPLLRLTKPI